MFRRIHAPTLLGWLLPLLPCGPNLVADTLILPPAADGYVRAIQSTSQTNNTANTVLLCGATATTDDFLRAVLAFDLSAPTLDGATINGASLILTVSERDTSNGGSDDADRTLDLHALDTSFTEAAVSWTEREAGLAWSAPGGDFGSVLASLAANPATVDTGTTLNLSGTALTEIVQAALGSTLGLLAKALPENDTRAIFRIGSREGTKVAGPRLLIDYTPAATPPSASVSPVPGHPEQALSPRYTVTAGGHSVQVKAERYSFDVAMFTLGDEPALVSINVADDFSDYTLKPTRHGLAVTRTGNILSFTLSEPLRLVLQITGRTPLVLIVTPPEDTPPFPGDPDIIYFAPGVTDAGVIRPTDNQTVYLAPGALVKGRIEAKNVSHVTVKGRGILETAGYSTRTGRTPGILFEDATDILVEGIGVRSYYTYWQTLYLNSRSVTVADMNIFGLGVNTDGVDIDAVKDFVVRDTFIRAEDDGLGWHSLDAAANGEPVTERALADNIVIWNTGAGNGVRIGASMEAQLWRDITLRNLDILQHAGAGLYSDYSDWAWMQDLRFENVAIERAASPITFQITKTGYSNSTGFLDERGHFDGLVFKNITAAGGTIKLLGYDATHRIDRVRFIDCTNAGTPLTSASQLTLNAYVTDLAFGAEPPARSSAAPGIYEAEDLETLTNQLPQYIEDNASAGGGRIRVCLASAAGNWIEHTLEAPAAGTYRLKLRVRRTPASGIIRLDIDGATLGSGQDLYAEADAYDEIDYGDVVVPAAGSLRLLCTVTRANAASAGHRVDIDSVKLLTPLQAWRDLHFNTTADSGDAADSADPDGDGLPNLLEFATGQPPLVKQASDILTTVSTTTPRHLSLAFTRLTPAPVNYSVEASDDLIAWTSVAALASSQSSWTGSATVSETPVDANTCRTVVEDSADLSTTGPRFLRLAVTPP